MDIVEIEKRLVGLDEEIHRLLQYISRSKKSEVEVELRDYEDLKKKIARDLKEPLDPTVEIRRMRERKYLV
jgi:predicted glycosyltransferase